MIRCFFTALVFVAMTLVLLPFQLIAMALRLPLQRSIPLLYHRVMCAMIGIGVRQSGRRAPEIPLLILSNHVSWLDILVIGSLGPVVFVAKKEVSRWPVLGWLSRLQRTVFVDRERRHRTGATTQEIADRLLGGDAVVLFAEGTSSDGNRILPFRSALIGAVHHAIGQSTHHDTVTVQPLSLAYVRQRGLPIGRALRERVAWYGDNDLIPHVAGVLTSGDIEVVVSWGEPVAYDMTADRKIVTREAENAVRRMTTAALRGTAPASAPIVDAPAPAEPATA